MREPTIECCIQGDCGFCKHHSCNLKKVEIVDNFRKVKVKEICGRCLSSTEFFYLEDGVVKYNKVTTYQPTSTLFDKLFKRNGDE